MLLTLDVNCRPEHCFKPQTRMPSRECDAELFSYRKPARSVSNATEWCSLKLLKRSCSRLPVSPIDVQAIAATTGNAIHDILRLTGEVVTDVICASETSVISLYTPLMLRRLSLIPVHCPADGLDTRRAST